jgi:hypothetical protein
MSMTRRELTVRAYSVEEAKSIVKASADEIIDGVTVLTPPRTRFLGLFGGQRGEYKLHLLSTQAQVLYRPDATAPAEKQYRESDNMGTRHDTFNQSTTWWAINMMVPKGAFLVYTFPSGPEARAALLELEYMREVKTTGKIICTEVLTYGYYQRDDGTWSAQIIGHDLRRNMWDAAKAAFLKHGGKKKSEKEPE